MNKRTFIIIIMSGAFWTESCIDIRIRTRLGRLKREVFIAHPLNHTVIEPLIVAFCDPLIAARVVTVECVWAGDMPNTCGASRPISIGAHLAKARVDHSKVLSGVKKERIQWFLLWAKLRYSWTTVLRIGSIYNFRSLKFHVCNVDRWLRQISWPWQRRGVVGVWRGIASGTAIVWWASR